MNPERPEDQETRDRQLGMNRHITRRDFLNGVAVGIGALGYARLPDLASGSQGVSQAQANHVGEYYPPALTGIRGSAPGSYDAATRCAMEPSGKVSLLLPSTPARFMSSSL